MGNLFIPRYLIARSHCYALDVTQNNDDVMMQVGQIYWSYPQRPLFLLQRQGTERQLTEQLDNCVRIPYPWHDTPNQAEIADGLRNELNKQQATGELQAKAHYLSARAMRGVTWIPPQLAQALAQRYQTIEELLAKEAHAA
jgi:hypothetical protein